MDEKLRKAKNFWVSGYPIWDSWYIVCYDPKSTPSQCTFFIGTIGLQYKKLNWRWQTSNHATHFVQIAMAWLT